MFQVNKDKCTGCTLCIKDCPANDILLKEDNKAHIKNESCLSCGHCIAICPKEAVSTDSYDMEEVMPYDSEQFTISPENLMNFIKFRRSTRKFKDTPIEKATLEQIIEAGRFTQTGSNSQDVSYVVLSDTLEEVTDLIYDVLKQQGECILANPTPETAGILSFYANMWVNMYHRYHEDKKNHDRLFFHAPAVILVTANNPTNGALASSNMELMANALGIGSCYIGFALRALNDKPELLEKIGVEPGKTIAACLAMGYPKVTYQRTVPRKKASIEWR